MLSVCQASLLMSRNWKEPRQGNYPQRQSGNFTGARTIIFIDQKGSKCDWSSSGQSPALGSIEVDKAVAWEDGSVVVRTSYSVHLLGSQLPHQEAHNHLYLFRSKEPKPSSGFQAHVAHNHKTQTGIHTNKRNK